MPLQITWLPNRLPAELARAFGKLPFVLTLPFRDERGIGPGKIVVRVHLQVFVLRVFGRAGVEILRRFTLQVTIGKTTPP